MGVNIHSWNFFHDVLRSCDRELSSLRICLLGNLYMGRGTDALMAKYKTHVVQEVFKQEGASVVSIDINGKDGALIYDLQQPLPESLGKFDVIFNGGTTEHIKNQVKCFENIHNICKIDGLMLHNVPLKNNWQKHGYYAYTDGFFKDLARKNRYSVVDFRRSNLVTRDKKKPFDLILTCLRKEYDSPFAGLSLDLLQRTKQWLKG